MGFSELSRPFFQFDTCANKGSVDVYEGSPSTIDPQGEFCEDNNPQIRKTSQTEFTLFIEGGSTPSKFEFKFSMEDEVVGNLELNC